MFKFFKKEKKSVRDYFASTLMTEVVAEYSEWYDQNGLYLPPDYATRPSEWNEDLHKIVRALELLDEGGSDGEYASTEAEQAEIVEGLSILGKQLYYMTDVVKPLRPAH